MIFRHYLKSEFVRNILTLMTGAVIAQIIPFIASPLLTRIYSPADFGLFALYSAIVGTTVVVSGGRYELAIMLPGKNEDANAIAVLSGLLTLMVSLLTFVLILIFKDYLILYVNPDLKAFLWIVPLGLLFSGMFQILNSLSTRNKLFRTTSASKVTQSGITIGSQVLFKSIGFTSIGLISGKVAGDLVAFIYLLAVNLFKNTFSFASVTIKRVKENAMKYRDFPRFQAISAFLNQLSQHLPAFILTFYYSPYIAGFYALTTRILSAPIRLIGVSAREVYFQKASELFAKGENIFNLYMKTTAGLAKIGILPFILFGISANYLFVLIFGADWYIAGVYAQIITVWSFFLFINAPTTTTIYILNLQKFGLKFEVVSVFLRLLSLLAGYYFFNNHYLSIAFFAGTGVLLNIFLILYIYRNLKKHG